VFELAKWVEKGSGGGQKAIWERDGLDHGWEKRMKEASLSGKATRSGKEVRGGRKGLRII